MNCTLCSFTPDFHANHAEQLRALKALLEDIHDQAEILLHLHRRVRELANNTFNLTSMVSDLTLRKLQTVRGAHDHDLVAGADGLSLPELLERRQGNTSVWAVEHAREVSLSSGVHKLLLGRLLHDSVRLLQRVDGAVDGHGIADLDRGSKGGLSLDRLELLESGGVRAVQGVRVVRLSHHHPGKLVHEPELLAHLESLVKRVHVTEVSTGDDDVVGNLPVKLLEDLDGGGLLSLEAKGVEGVRQVDGELRGHLANQAHAAIEVGVDGHHERPVSDGLHELRQGDLVRGKEHDGRDARGSRVRREGGGGVTSGRASDGRERLALLPHPVHLGHERGHTEVLERAGVAVAALLHPQVVHAKHLAAVAVGPEEVGVALEHGDDVLVGNPGEDPFLLAPHARAVGPDGLADALVEESLPVLGRVDGEGLHVVLDIEETAVLAPVDDVVDRVRLVLITREWHVLAVEKSALLEGSCEKGGEGQRGIWRNLSAGALVVDFLEGFAIELGCALTTTAGLLADAASGGGTNTNVDLAGAGLIVDRHGLGDRPGAQGASAGGATTAEDKGRIGGESSHDVGEIQTRLLTTEEGAGDESNDFTTARCAPCWLLLCARSLCGAAQRKFGTNPEKAHKWMTWSRLQNQTARLHQKSILMFSLCRFVMSSSIGTIPEAQAHARLLFGHDSLDCQGVQIGG